MEWVCKPSSVSLSGRRPLHWTGRRRPALPKGLPIGTQPTRRIIPGPGNRHIWSCRRWGLPCRRRCRRRGALLPHLFTLACAIKAIGGSFSVALSRGSPRAVVSRHRALPCSDFPPDELSLSPGGRPTHSTIYYTPPSQK